MLQFQSARDFPFAAVMVRTRMMKGVKIELSLFSRCLFFTSSMMMFLRTHAHGVGSESKKPEVAEPASGCGRVGRGVV